MVGMDPYVKCRIGVHNRRVPHANDMICVHTRFKNDGIAVHVPLEPTRTRNAIKLTPTHTHALARAAKRCSASR